MAILKRTDDVPESLVDKLLTTRTGFRFHVRPVIVSDDHIMKEFFSHVTREDLRFRFLSSMHEVSSDQISMLIHPDHDRAESFVAFTEDRSMMIATGMLACDNGFNHGEVAIVIREDHKRKGISWELLAYIARFAEAKGVKTIESIERRENHQAIELQRDMGFVAQSYPGDATLMLLTRSLGK